MSSEYEMKILGEWDDGGFTPYQAFLPVEYRGIKYTIYVRERGWISCDIWYGIHDLLSPDGKAKIKHLLREDEIIDSESFGTANIFDLFKWEEIRRVLSNPEDDILNLAIEKARIFFETADYLPWKLEDKDSCKESP